MKPEPSTNIDKHIQALIRDLAKVKNPNLGLSPTMSGDGFAPSPWTHRMLNGILMDHGLENLDAFTKLVEYGPKPCHSCLIRWTTKPQRSSRSHTEAGFGGMWYGHPPAIRWGASDAELIKDLSEQKLDDQRIAEYSDASPEFIAEAKNREVSEFFASNST